MSTFLVINPGSTSTKLAVFQGEKLLLSHTVSHSQEELAPYNKIIDQRDFRKKTVMDSLEREGFSAAAFSGVIAIGGLLRNVDSGVYEVNDCLAEDLSKGAYGEHAANLGGLLAKSIGNSLGIPSYIADPITVDEMQDVARISGHPLLPRYGRTHTLNHKRVAMTASRDLGKPYEESRLIVAHLGGGVSIGAHAGGRIIDSTSSRGEGAFSMDRSGGLNSWELAKLCFSGKHSKQEVLAMLNGKGGVSAYLGTRDFRDVERSMEEGSLDASQVFHGFLYRVTKEIGAMAAVLEGSVDAVILTGGIAFSSKVVQIIRNRVSFIGPVLIYPGEQEMESLAFYYRAVESGEIPVKEYGEKR